MRNCFFLIMSAALIGCAHRSLTVENDILDVVNSNKDHNYTHGTKFSYIDETEETKQTYSLGQNIYTPSGKRPESLGASLKNDRPFTGWLYLEHRSSTLRENIKDVWGIQVGCTGRCSMAKETQQGIHKALGQLIPDWKKEFSLKSEPGVVLELERYYGLPTISDYLDSDIYFAGKVGSIITNAGLGLEFRFGYLDLWGSDPIIVKAPRTPSSLYTAYFFGKLEERFVPYNHFLEGSLFQDERHTVDTEEFVTQGDLGFTLGYENIKFTYRYTIFSNEWEEQKGNFHFGGIDIAW